MTQHQPEDGIRNKRRWVEQAVSLAMQNRWADAAEMNRRILEHFPNDVDAHNRLGRALTELGQYAGARQAYSKANELDPHNTIAQKNLARLSLLPEEKAPVKAQQEQVDPRLFIAETGKTGVTQLLRPAPREVMAKMTVGDKVYLKPEGRALIVRNANDDYLGQVEPRLSQRLIDLMRGGNRYDAALVSMDDNVRVIIREVYQDPSQSGKVSFPTKGAEAMGVRPYIKETLIRYEEEDDEEEGEEEYELGAEPEAEEAAEEGGFEEEEPLIE